MSIATIIHGIVRGTTDEASAELNSRNELLVSQGLPPYTEIARQAKMWSVIQTAATAALVVRPSTVAAITLWNGEGTGGKSYIIDRLFTQNLVGLGNAEYLLYACIHPAGMTKPTADIPGSATNLVGCCGKLYNGMAVVDVGATVVDNGWYPWGLQGTTVTVTTPGGGTEAQVSGRLIVPPQGAVSVQVVATATGATFTSGISWIEEQLVLA